MSTHQIVSKQAWSRPGHGGCEGSFFGDFLGQTFGNLIFLGTKKTFWTEIFGLALDP